MRDEVDRLVVFNSGPMLFGLDLDVVQEVVAACEISPLPDGPTPVAGIVTIDAQVMAVVDPKRHFAPDGVSQPAVDTRFLLVQSPVGTIALPSTIEMIVSCTAAAYGDAALPRR